jgi:hypothetical protein
MITNIKTFSVFVLLATIGFSGCKKTEYAFGEIKTPTNFVANATVVGVDATNLYGDGSGNVTFIGSAEKVLSFTIDFDDEKPNEVIAGNTFSMTHTYATPDTSEHNITITAVGTGGSTSIIAQKIKLRVAYEPPAEIIANLTNGGSQVWVTDKNAPGHVGVGPVADFFPIWYAATPNSRDACLYDDEITFTKTGLKKASISVDNKGQTFIIAAATAFYSLSGGDNCYNVANAAKTLSFSKATSASTTSNSTRVQFTVSGNGIVNFATGGTTYEILALSPTTLYLRNIGVDGNSWYQKLKIK